MKNLKDIWKKAMYIFNARQKRRLIFLLMILAGETFFELMGIVSVYPFIALVLSPDMIETNPVLNYIYRLSGITSNGGFFLLIAILITVFYIVKNLYNMLAQYIRYGFVYDTKRELGVRLMGKYMEEPYSFFLEKNSAVLMRGVGSDVGRFYDLIFSMLYVLSDGFMMVIIGTFLLFTDFVLSFSVTIVMVLFVLFFVRWNKERATFYGRETQKCSSSMTQWLQQAFGGAKEIKILRREKYFVDNYNKYSEMTNRMGRKLSFINTIPHNVLECFCTTVILMVIAVRMINGADPTTFVPRMSIFAMALFRLFPRFSRINGNVNAVMFNYPSMDSLYEDLKMTEEHKYRRDMLEEEGKHEHQFTFNDSISLENIHYAYPNTNVEVLKGINLEIKKGQAVGLVGPSGAGKTTLVDCILGILELQQGQVKCDGLDIQNHIKEWSGKLGYIPQTIFLSDDTVRNNVAFGLEETEESDEMVWKALEQAQLKDFVEGLPNGLDTKIGERGVRFSGGQRQRIGIARALYNNPDILVLDEATSALDNETEQAVMESIERLLGHKTMIIIAHRITTVKNCDVIYRVDGGDATLVKYEDLTNEV